MLSRTVIAILLNAILTFNSARGQRLVAQQLVPWNLARIAHRLPGHGSYIYDPRAGNGVHVYVLDTGVDVLHYEFEHNRAVLGKSFIIKEPHEDLHGHGTAIAGVIAGIRYGVAKRARIVSVKIANKHARATLR